MATTTEFDTYLRIGNGKGDSLLIVPTPEELRYDFVDEETGDRHITVALIDDPAHKHPEFRVEVLDDLTDPALYKRARQCSKVALGLLVEVDTQGAIHGGLRYNESFSNMPVGEIFPGAHQRGITEYELGQSAIRGAYKKGFLREFI